MKGLIKKWMTLLWFSFFNVSLSYGGNIYCEKHSEKGFEVIVYATKMGNVYFLDAAILTQKENRPLPLEYTVGVRLVNKDNEKEVFVSAASDTLPVTEANNPSIIAKYSKKSNKSDLVFGWGGTVVIRVGSTFVCLKKDDLDCSSGDLKDLASKAWVKYGDCAILLGKSKIIKAAEGVDEIHKKSREAYEAQKKEKEKRIKELEELN